TTKSCLPPPPPPPPSCGTGPSRDSSPPQPQHAARPFICDARCPIQETGDQGDNSHNFQNTSAPPQHTDNSTPPPPPLHGEEDTETNEGKKQHPVQETDPPPQAYENPQPSETANPEGNVSVMDEDDDIQRSR
ncbi:hypothetical protein CCH79_00012447, partial [Gambusia affinis]